MSNFIPTITECLHGNDQWCRLRIYLKFKVKAKVITLGWTRGLAA